MRELTIYALLGAVFIGVKSAYATFVGYDEVAHHSGIERPESLTLAREARPPIWTAGEGGKAGLASMSLWFSLITAKVREPHSSNGMASRFPSWLMSWSWTTMWYSRTQKLMRAGGTSTQH